MKRFYNYFLSLFLLMAVGISGAMAQAYREGNLLETVEAVTSQDILLNGTVTWVVVSTFADRAIRAL